MKKIFACLLAVLMLAGIMMTASAAEFTPSVTAKPGPTLVPVVDPDGNPRPGFITDKDGNIVGYLDEDCIVITPISEADISEEIPESAKDTLLWVYQQLVTGKMTMPYEKHNPTYNSNSMVIRDMFDVTFLCGDHPEMLEDVGVVLVLTFDLGVEPGQDVSVMTYKEGEWNDIEKITNNGDGTVTCTFEHLCPVAISVPSMTNPPSQTGDTDTFSVWGIVALVALAGIVGLSVVYFRSSKKEVQ